MNKKLIEMIRKKSKKTVTHNKCMHSVIKLAGLDKCENVFQSFSLKISNEVLLLRSLPRCQFQFRIKATHFAK